MLHVDRIRIGQFVSIVGSQEFPLPEGIAEGELVRVILVDRNSITGETHDGRRVEINGVVMLPQVNDSAKQAFPAAPAGPFARVQDPALDHSGGLV